MIALIVVGALIGIMTLVSYVVSNVLFFKYIKYNRTPNYAGLTGKDIARDLLDKNELENIKVSNTGSLLFGNSYSHYFKKIRLRRGIYKKSSITSMAMASEKVALAVMDKEGDKDMRDRVKLVPLMTFGPLAFIPIILIGVLLDYVVLHTEGIVTFVFLILGLAFYVYSIVLSVRTLKTEKKAQVRAVELLKNNNLAEEDEINMINDLYNLYNIEYVNDIILSSLELLYRVLQLALKIVQNSKKK